MPDASHFYAIRNLAVNDGAWTPITAPIDCNSFSVQCGADMKIRTDASNAETEQAIPAGTQQYILASWSWTGYRFHKDGVIAYLQAVSGSPTAVLTFVC